VSNAPGLIWVIPARGGSKGILRKNIKLLAGQPLITYTIKAALQSKYLTRVILSTEDEEIAEIAKEYGAQVTTRPVGLATDTALTSLVLEHVVRHLEETENYRADVVVLLQPTSPLRNSRHIDEALGIFFRDGYDSLLSVCPSHAFIWRMSENRPYPLNYDFANRPMRQDRELEYRENGAIYITKYETLISKHNHLGGKIGLYVMPEGDSLEIDTEFEFWLSEQIMSKKSKNRKGGKDRE